MKNRGTVSIPLAAAIATMALISGGTVTYFSTQSSAAEKVSTNEGNIKVLQNEDININKRFDTLEENMGRREVNMNKRFDSLETVILKAIRK